MFDIATIEKINYYVYCLVNPIDNQIFYVGKGNGNRVFEHVKCASKHNNKSDKLDIIREINKQGMEVRHYILRYGLTEKEAFEVESALIDFIGLDNLSNEIKGFHSYQGKIECNELNILYAAEECLVEDKVLIIKINREFKYDMTSEELYNATRLYWSLSKVRVQNVEYIFSVYNGIVREVYKPTNWYKPEGSKKGKLAFEGIIAEENIRSKYLHKTVKKYIKKGSANPLRYINC